MIVKYSDTKIRFAILVEHPAGHDCGDFIQEHTIGIDDSGRVTYDYELPQDQHNQCEFGYWSYRNLANEAEVVLSSEGGVWTNRSLKSIVSVLKQKCESVGVPIPKNLLASLEAATELVVTFDSGPGPRILDAGNEHKSPENVENEEN